MGNSSRSIKDEEQQRGPKFWPSSVPPRRGPIIKSLPTNAASDQHIQGNSEFDIAYVSLKFMRTLVPTPIHLCAFINTYM